MEKRRWKKKEKKEGKVCEEKVGWGLFTGSGW